MHMVSLPGFYLTNYLQSDFWKVKIVTIILKLCVWVFSNGYSLGVMKNLCRTLHTHACGGLESINFTHIFQAFFTGSGTIISLPQQCQWRNSKWYGKCTTSFHNETVDITTTKQNTKTGYFTHWGWVTHICSLQLGHHWFR